MPVQRSGPAWRRISILLLFIVAGLYFLQASKEFPHGGSTLGMAYGIAGTLLILLLAFFGIRKRWYRSRFGTLEQWLQSHIYLGVLTLAILLFHTGGRFNDRIAVITLLLVAIVVLSGIFGAVLYATVPRLLTEVESNLTVEELSEQLNQLAKQMARLASGRSAPFQRMYDELMREATPGWAAGWRLLFLRTRQRGPKPAGEWQHLLTLVPKGEEDELRQLLVVSRQRKELLLRLIYQQRYKNVLESWLYVHIPFTMALLVFMIVHIVAVFYYRSVAP